MTEIIELKITEINGFVDELETLKNDQKMSSELVALSAAGISFFIANYVQEIQQQVVPMNLIIELLKVSERVEKMINEQESDNE